MEDVFLSKLTIPSISHIQMGQHMRFWYFDITYTQMPPLNIHAYISRRARSLDVGQSLYQHLNFVYMRCEGSGEAVCMRMLVEPSLLAYTISTKSHMWAQKIF